MKVIAIVQARIGSTRLPGKVLMNIANKPMLWHVVDRLKRAKTLNMIVLATSIKEQDRILVEFAEKNGMKSFAGSEDDVLDRYLRVAEKIGADIVVRVTADNPLTDPYIIDRMVTKHIEMSADYTCVNDLPLGTSAEVISIDTLKRVHELGTKPHYREHVTTFIKENPKLFDMYVMDIENNLQRPELRLTVDTEEDLNLMRIIYARLYRPDRIISIDKVIDLLDKQPELRGINAHIKQKNI
jgi:spore coat polysaccharide biosynthesis protein SpsF